MNNKFIILIIIACLGLGLGAKAQDQTVLPVTAPSPAAPPKMANIKKGKVSVTFDDELVKGSAVSPEGDVITSRLENRFKRFIKVRKDFIQDVENSKDEFGHK